MVTPLNALTHSLSITYPYPRANHLALLPQNLTPVFLLVQVLCCAPGEWDRSPSTGAIFTARTANLPPEQLLNCYSLPTNFFATKHKPELTKWLVIDIICTWPGDRTGLIWAKRASLWEKCCSVFKMRRQPDVVPMQTLCHFFLIYSTCKLIQHYEITNRNLRKEIAEINLYVRHICAAQEQV